jgi:hypothetical protein
MNKGALQVRCREKRGDHGGQAGYQRELHLTEAALQISQPAKRPTRNQIKFEY